MINLDIIQMMRIVKGTTLKIDHPSVEINMRKSTMHLITAIVSVSARMVYTMIENSVTNSTRRLIMNGVMIVGMIVENVMIATMWKADLDMRTMGMRGVGRRKGIDLRTVRCITMIVVGRIIMITMIMNIWNATTGMKGTDSTGSALSTMVEDGLRMVITVHLIGLADLSGMEDSRTDMTVAIGTVDHTVLPTRVRKRDIPSNETSKTIMSSNMTGKTGNSMTEKINIASYTAGMTNSATHKTDSIITLKIDKTSITAHKIDKTNITTHKTDRTSIAILKIDKTSVTAHKTDKASITNIQEDRTSIINIQTNKETSHLMTDQNITDRTTGLNTTISHITPIATLATAIPTIEVPVSGVKTSRTIAILTTIINMENGKTRATTRIIVTRRVSWTSIPKVSGTKTKTMNITIRVIITGVRGTTITIVNNGVGVGAGMPGRINVLRTKRTTTKDLVNQIFVEKCDPTIESSTTTQQMQVQRKLRINSICWRVFLRSLQFHSSSTNPNLPFHRNQMKKILETFLIVTLSPRVRPLQRTSSLTRRASHPDVAILIKGLHRRNSKTITEKPTTITL